MNSATFTRKNDRRVELIKRPSLTPEETAELDLLSREITGEVEAKYPLSTDTCEICGDPLALDSAYCVCPACVDMLRRALNEPATRALTDSNAQEASNE